VLLGTAYSEFKMDQIKKYDTLDEYQEKTIIKYFLIFDTPGGMLMLLEGGLNDTKTKRPEIPPTFFCFKGSNASQSG
jgi:hypothetical protein